MRKKTTAGKERTRRQLEQTIAAYQKLAAHGESIFEYSPRSSAVKDYVKFLDEVEKIIGFREK